MLKWCADFETTTDINDCRVWAYGVYSIDNNTFEYGTSLSQFFKWIDLHNDLTLYFHNLKFDGEFILSYLLESGYSHSREKTLSANQFNTLISNMGQFYSIKICLPSGVNVTIYDSLKILPFSVKIIAESFGLAINKGELNYKTFRPVNHQLTTEEISYLKNDVQIVAEALKILFSKDMKKMTQGSNALADFKKIYTPKRFSRDFPSPNYDYFIRQSYRGGFTYLSPEYAGKEIGRGLVLDVNSLYPSVMYYCKMPYGTPLHFSGEYTNDSLYDVYIQYITCNFELKKKRIPTIQLKNNSRFIPTDYVVSSNGEDVTLCLTNVDMELFFEQYTVTNIVYHEGWKFKSAIGLFKNYIDKWTTEKTQAKLNDNKGLYTLSKLMLNALYGKFALNPDVQSKIPVLLDGIVKYKLGDAETRTPIYIPVASFITSYARNKTIRAAQSLYDRFVYADTDSLHLIGQEIPDNLMIHKTTIGAWDDESYFSRAKFLRQKSYIEEINGHYKITCAGMPESCHQYVTWDNFNYGSIFKGKLVPKHCKGGLVLVDTDFTIQNKHKI